MDKKEILAIIEKNIASCKKCPLHECRSKTVPGVGNIDNRIMFIGEGPGADEDAQGIPFVGRSGQLLTKILKSAGFEREDVYITNTVKCRPPENRNPSEDEMKSCYPFLESQIALINPIIIVTVGAVPTKWILKDVKEGITKLRGNFYDWNGIKVMPILHPSYLLRNSSNEEGKPKWLTWQDMLLLKKEFDRQKEK